MEKIIIFVGFYVFYMVILRDCILYICYLYYRVLWEDNRWYYKMVYIEKFIICLYYIDMKFNVKV